MANPKANATIQVDDYEVTSNSETADDMIATHQPEGYDSKGPRKVGKDGKPVEPKPEKGDISKAASALGKRGGKAAAEKRAAEKDDAEVEGDEPEKPAPAPKKKPTEKEEPEGDEAADDEKGEGAAEEDAAGDDKGDGDPEPEPAEPPKKAKPRDDLQARLRQQSEVISREREARERAEAELRQVSERIAALERGGVRKPAGEGDGKPQPGQPGQGGEQDDDPEPKLEDFPVFEDGLRAIREWDRRQSERTAEQRILGKIARQQQVYEHAKRHTDTLVSQVEAHHQRITAALAADPKLAERIDPRLAHPPSFVLAEGQKPGPFNLLSDEVVRSENGIRVLAYISEHAEEMIPAMKQAAVEAFKSGHDADSGLQNARVAIAREFALAEAAMLHDFREPRQAPRKPAPSNARPPVTPVPSSAIVSDDERAFAEDTPYEEHATIWNARDKAARKRA